MSGRPSWDTTLTCWLPGARVVSTRGTSVVREPVCTCAVTFQTPASESCAPLPVQAPEPVWSRSSSLVATWDRPTGSKRSRTPVATTGSPVSKSVTSARKSFGPASPGVAVRATFVVVAKSLPDAEIDAAAGGACGSMGSGVQSGQRPRGDDDHEGTRRLGGHHAREQPVAVSEAGDRA